jgi:diadenosine tetraphosphatase ApaH/serine/threonine PP2A family protein phosphatase
MHGLNIRSVLSGHEHVGDPSSAFRFEPNPNASQAANTIVQQAMQMAHSVSQESADCFDRDWFGPQGQDTLLTLFNTTHTAGIANSIETLSSEVRQILASQPTLVEATVPAKVYGDIHGQLRDMLLQLFHFGFPQSQGPEFIFNGDWVDRGAHQVEVVSLIFALKAMYPNRVWIIRGNHEDVNQCRGMGAVGFENACVQRFGPVLGPKVFGTFGQTFDYLPLGCLVNKKILVVHGGIGDGQWTLNQLAAIQRPIPSEMVPTNSVVYNVMWSDPIADDPGQEVFGVHDSPRNAPGQKRIFTFGKAVTDRFCAVNQIEMIVRSHQALARGFGYDVMHGGRCVRVFSARDYEGQGNDGAVLSIVEGDGHLLARAQVIRSLACPKADATPLVDPTPMASSSPQKNPFCL